MLSVPSAAGATVPTGCHVPAVRDSSDTGARPRARPVRRPDDPYVSGAGGGTRASTPTENHVDRSLSRRRSDVPSNERLPRSVTTVIVITRPEEFNAVCTSCTGPGTWSARASFAPLNVTGPQSWYGEIVS